MQDIVIHPTYFPSIAHFVAIAKAKSVVFEMHDNYQKQTYRNRTNIQAANGKLGLTVPVSFTQKNRQLYRDVKIAYDSNWQTNHWKSLESAYKMSPFFEYYQDELYLLFQLKETFILDLNLKCMDLICNFLELELTIQETTYYQKEITSHKDLRWLVNAKKESPQNFDRYIQVFEEKQGFMSNLSILDLLFNEGPNSLNYLESQILSA